MPELAPGGTFLPLALEYTFWNERAPEMLAAFGEPIPACDFLAERITAAPVEGHIEDGLTRHAANREIPHDAVPILPCRLDSAALEPQRRVLLGVKKIGGT